MSGRTRVLGVFTLAMINVAAVTSLRNLPLMADSGWAAVFYYLLAGLTFFIPCSLVAAELATGWPSTGGVYTWVKEAFGARWGFVAIWLQWIENVVYYPTILSFTAATIAYLINPELVHNPGYIVITVFTAYWGCTIIDAMGMKASGLLSSIGALLGTIFPAIVIILLGLGWVLSGQPTELQFSWSALIPDMSKMDNIGYYIGVLLGLSGMEMSAVHAREVTNPQRDYPRAIFGSCFLILAIYLLGTLAIAAVVPKKDINLVAGVMQAFTAFFAAYNMEWMTKVIAALIVVGALATVGTWIVGPSKGMLQTAREGHLPPFFQYKNRYGMPIAILLIQGIIVSLVTLIFLFMPDVSSSYWAINALASVLYLVMYSMMFAAAIRLRYKFPDVKRAYRIPGGKYFGMWVVGGLGFLACIFALAIGFMPPSNLDKSASVNFALFLGIGLVTMILLPLIFDAFQKDHWKHKSE